jgi:hypothetical protein
MLPKDPLDARRRLGVQVRQEQILLACKANSRAVSRDNLVKRGFDAPADPAALDEDAIEEPPVRLSVAPEMIVKRELGERYRVAKLKGSALPELVAEPVYSPFRQQVLEARMTAVGPIPMVTKDRSDDPHRFYTMIDWHESERLGEARGGVGLVVGHSEPAADQEIEPPYSAFAHDRE